MTRLDLLEALLRHWRKMVEFTVDHEAPALVTISRDGVFTELILPPIALP